MKQSILVALLTTGVSLSSVAVAQYVGTTEAQYTNLAQLLETGKDDDYVQLEGQLIKKVGSEKYIFTDGNQEVRVEIDSENFPSEPFDENATIQIQGEFEKEFMESPEIDVDVVTIVKQ